MRPQPGEGDNARLNRWRQGLGGRFPEIESKPVRRPLRQQGLDQPPGVVLRARPLGNRGPAGVNSDEQLTLLLAPAEHIVRQQPNS